LQLTRSARAFKVWLSLKTFGLEPFRQAIDHCLDLAELAARQIRENPAFELLSPAHLGVVAFRVVPRAGMDADALNREVLDRLNRSGYAFLSSTRSGDAYALRLCILSHRSTARDVTGVLDRLIELAREVEGA